MYVCTCIRESEEFEIMRDKEKIMFADFFKRKRVVEKRSFSEILCRSTFSEINF